MKAVKGLILSVLVLGLALSAHAQNESGTLIPAKKIMYATHAKEEISEYKFILSPGVSYQNGAFAELNIMYAQTANNHMGFGIRGPRLGFETNFSSQNYTFAPKAGYEVSLFFFCLRGNVVSYFDETKKADLRLLPEIGLSFFGLANLTYGYGFSLLEHKSNVGPNRVALTFNLSHDLWRDLFE